MYMKKMISDTQNILKMIQGMNKMATLGDDYPGKDRTENE